MPQNYVRPSSPPPTYDEVSKVCKVLSREECESKARSSSRVTLTGATKLAFERESPPEYAFAVAVEGQPLHEEGGTSVVGTNL